MLKPILVTLVYLSSNLHSSHDFLKNRVFHALHRRIKIEQVIEDVDPHPERNNPVDWYNRYGELKDYVRDSFHPDPNSIVVIYVQPIRYPSGFLADAGLAQICQPENSGRTALVFGGNRKADHSNNLWEGQLVETHEVGHVLGALHDDHIYTNNTQYTIMYPYIQDTPGEVFSAKSIREMRACQTDYQFRRYRRRPKGIVK